MKKSKILKLLVSALSLCLIIGAMVGITAMADGSGDANKPEIISYNVSYSDELYLYYAVDADLEEGQSIELWVCDSEGNVLEDVEPTGSLKEGFSGKITEYDTQTIWAGTDDEITCYVFKTNGVAAKDINAVEYVKAVIVDGEGKKVSESDRVEYSVMQYLYQRLYKDEIVVATEGKDNIRRELYFDLLSYGAAAQELLLNDELAADTVDSIRDTKMLSVADGNGTKLYVSDHVQLNHNGNVPAGKIFYGWDIYTYTAGGVKNSDYAVAADKAKIDTVDVAAIFATPVYVDEGYEGEIPTNNTVGMIDFTTKPTAEQMGYEAVGGTLVENTNGDNYLAVTQNGNNWVSIPTTPIYTEENANSVEISANLYMPANNTYEFAIIKGEKRAFYLGIGLEGEKLAIRNYYGESSSNMSYAYLGFNGEYINYNEWFNIKFVVEEGPYNYGNYGLHLDVYLNGKLFTSFGDTYTSISSAGEITGFNFYGNTANVGTYKIDDFVFTKTAEEVDPNNGEYIVDFDTTPHFGKNSRVTVSSGVKFYASGTGNVLNVLDSYTDKNGKTLYNVAHINKVAASASVTGIILNRESKANVAVFEFDFCAMDGAIELWMANSGGTTKYTGLASNADDPKIGGLAANLNEWTHVKIVYYIGQDGKSYTTITMNDKTTTATRTDYYDVSNIFGMSFNVASQGVGDYYIDNFVSYAYYDAEYDFTVLPEKQGITFDDGVIPATITGANGSAVTHTVVDAGKGNKALKIVKASTGYTSAGLFVQATEIEDGADTFIFECDMYVAQFNSLAVYITNGTVLNGSSNLYYTKYASHSGNPVKFGNDSAGYAEGAVGKWIHFKLEYTKVDGIGQSTITIDDTTIVLSNADTIDITQVDRIMFCVQGATIHDVLYDNIVCKMVKSAE